MDRKELQRHTTRLKVVHAQRVMRHGDADPMPVFSAAGLSSDTRDSAALGWQSLLETEYESVVIAGWMTSALARLGAPLDLVGAFGRVVEDEIRHVDLCAQMVSAFDKKPLVPLAAPPPFPSQMAQTPEAEFEVIAGMVGFFCVFEHLSALMFRRAIDACEDKTGHWALSEIFRDEAFHGAFGFETAKHYVPRWNDQTRQRLADRVAQDIARFGKKLADNEKNRSPELKEHLRKLGLLAGGELEQIFFTGVETDLIPRLQELGVPIATQTPGKP